MYDDRVIKALDSFEVYYKNEKINFNKLEKRLLEMFMYENKDTNLYITPKENRYFLILLIVYSGLIQYLQNIYSEGNNLIDELKEGDILEFSKAKCKFIERGENTIKLEFADIIYTIPYKSLYKVSVYKGYSRKLNKYPANVNRGAKKTRNIISQILDIDNDAFSKVINKSTLIVASKNIIFSVIEDLKIKFNNELLDIGEVFPIAYCYSEDNYHYFRGNPSKQEPIVKCISKIYNAKEFVRKNKKINSVIILQDKVNNEDIEDIIYISKRSSINKVRMLLEPLSIEKHMENKDIKDKFNIINIDKEFYSNECTYNSDNISKYQYRLIRNYVNSTEKYITIKEFNFDKDKRVILNKCRNLINTFQDNKIIKFVINVRKIIKRLSNMILPLSEYEKYYIDENLKQFTVKSLIKELNYFYNSDFIDSLLNKTKVQIEEILNGCNSMYESVYKNNPKWTELEYIIRFTMNEKIAIIVDNKNIRDALRKFLNKKYSLKHNITVKSLNSLNDCIFDKIVYTSKMDENYYWNYKKFNSSNNIYILLKSERNNIKYLQKRYLKFIDESYELGYERTTFYDEDKEELEIIEENRLSNDLESLIATNYIPFNENGVKGQSTTKCEFVLIFNSGERAFLTSQYEAYVLNESKEELINKKSNKIEKGDLLLFVEGIDRDLIEKVMLELLSIDKLKEQYNDSFVLVNKWKEYLRIYIQDNNIKYNGLEKKMKEYGISRCGGTIRSWLLNSTVGPQDKEVLKVLGEVSGISILLNNYTECYEACSNIRKFQIRIRKSIAKYILKSSINEESDELDLLISNRIQKSIEYIKKVEVRNIFNINKEIPSYLVNRIIEE